MELRERLLGCLTDLGLRAANLGSLGRAFYSLGQVERAIKLYEQALANAREIGYHQNEGIWLGNLGLAYRAQGQVERAIEFHEQALAIAREIGDSQNESIWLGCLGLAYRELGQVEWAVNCYEGALAITREIDDHWNEGAWLGHVGIVYRAMGQVGRAIDFFEEALAIACEIGDRRHEGVWLDNLGLAYHDLEQIERAIEFHKRALAIAREIGYRRGESFRLLGLGRALLATRALSKARQHCAEALTLDMPATSYRAALTLGIVLLHQRDPTTGETFADAAARCRAMLDKTAGLYAPRYALATALVGYVVCDPRWAEEGERAELLAPALAEYRRALENCAAPGVVQDALRDLEMIQTAGMEGLEPAFELLKSGSP